jgi:hypothetical protein
MRSRKSPFKGRQPTSGVTLWAVRKGQVVTIPANDLPDQTTVIAGLFGVAA